MTEFCRHLSNAFAINNNGTDFSISPCCYFTKSDTVQDLDSLPELRKKWIASDLETNCRLCLNQEEQKQTSYRQAGFDIMDDREGLQMLTIAVTMQCNLACTSCGSHSSSFWHDENVRNGVASGPFVDRKGVDADKKLIEWFGTLDTTNLKYIKFGGGEPLMNNTHRKILELIDNPQDIVLQYTSNYTLFPSRDTIEQWKKFKLIKVIGSIDGVDEQFEYLRWPGKFDTIVKNINKAKEIYPGNVMFGIEHTLNPFNVYYYDRIEKWYNQTMATNRFGDKSDFNIHPCYGNIGIDKTPPLLRDKVKDKYGVDHPVSIMLDQYPYTEHKTAIDWVEKLDEWRELKWQNTFSEVAEYFNSH